VIIEVRYCFGYMSYAIDKIVCADRIYILYMITWTHMSSLVFSIEKAALLFDCPITVFDDWCVLLSH